MKKILVVLVIIVVIAGGLFYYNDLKAYLLIEDEMIKDSHIIRLFQNLEDKSIANEDSVIIKEAILKKPFSKDKKYTILLDYNFDEFKVKDGEKIYSINKYADKIYSLKAFQSLYNYKTKNISIKINGKEVGKREYHHNYLLYDKKYHSDSYEESQAMDMIISQKPEVSIPENSTLKVYREENIIYDDNITGDLYIPKRNGLYTYEITTEYQEDLYYGNVKTVFHVIVDFPPDFTVSDTKIAQGNIFTIKANNVLDANKLMIQSKAFELKFRKVEGSDDYIAVLATNYNTRPGKYSIKYGYDDVKEIELTILKRAFNDQYLTVKKSTVKKTQTKAAYAEYRKIYKTSLDKSTYQIGENARKFIIPVKGRLSTEYGVGRYVNNKKTSYHHNGLDIACKRGTKVSATSDGVVVLAQLLKVTGNTVVIDHGGGIFSSYLHMDKLAVNEGEHVKMGQHIGNIGTTGFSTGPHLHFSISYYRTYLEPGYFIYGEPVTYKNYKELFKKESK